jgi:hypothetical protein
MDFTITLLYVIIMYIYSDHCCSPSHWFHFPNSSPFMYVLCIYLFFYLDSTYERKHGILISVFLSIVYLFWVVLGFELRTSHLLSRHSIAWVIPTALFTLVILEIVSHFLSKSGYTVILLFYAFCLTELVGILPYPAIG